MHNTPPNTAVNGHRGGYVIWHSRQHNAQAAVLPVLTFSHPDFYRRLWSFTRSTGTTKNGCARQPNGQRLG